MTRPGDHPLLRRASWVKLILTAAIAVAAAVAHVPAIIINKTSPPPDPTVVRVGSGDLVKHDGKITAATCRDLAAHHHHAKRREILDTYGVPASVDGGDGDLLWLTYPLREDRWRTCQLDFDYRDHLDSVDMTLWTSIGDDR